MSKRATKKAATKKTAKKQAAPAKVLPKKAGPKRIPERPPEEARPSPQLVNRTIAMLEAHDRRNAESVRAIGAHVLSEYFGGSEELAASRNPKKARSYALLAERATEETEWDAAALRRAVDAARVYRSLPRDVRDELHAGWLYRLAAIDDLDERARVAARIAAGAVRGEAARREIARAGRDEAAGGRRAKPAAVRVALAVERALTLAAVEDAFGEDEVDEIDDAEREALADRLGTAAHALANLSLRLRA